MDRHYPVLAISTVSPYYGNVALRKINNRKRTRQTGRKTTGARKFHPGVIFWLAFFILMLGLFWVNRETIQKNYTQLVDRVSGQRQVPAPEVPPEEDIPPPPAAPVEVLQEPPVAQSPRETPSAGSRPVTVQPEPAQNTPPAGGPAPSAGPNREPAAEQRPAPAPEQPGRERNIYFTQVDKEGVILRSKTSRKISSSDSPMLDALGVLLQGPTTEEQRRGIVSLIPQGSRILSATVRGSTAYISFSEEFQYNTYGVEGYAAQLKQIVWTATEFPNIQDVQILIEGRRVDYLGEGIWIGSPLSRDEL
ncbi:MAG: GerMN domain-containing protein [Treponema sp.]|jgi:spore germination protein GerM|nr:GerMN domain-containing protein [Treponema sp.]